MPKIELRIDDQIYDCVPRAVEPPAIRHGCDVGPHNVGLRGAGVTEADLVVVSGNVASKLANGRTEDGRPLLRRLLVQGMLKIDCPCVVEECRVFAPGALYVVRNSNRHQWEGRYCEFAGPPAADGKVGSATVLYPYRLYRSIISGSKDGIKIPGAGGMHVEECWMHSQCHYRDNHNDAMQAVSADGAEHSYVILRNRIEGPHRAQTSAINLNADNAPITNVTIEGNLLAGGTYSIYLRSDDGGSLHQIRVRGNVWAGNSWLFGPRSADVEVDEWSDNWIAPMVGEHVVGQPLAVDLSAKVPYELGA